MLNERQITQAMETYEALKIKRLSFRLQPLYSRLENNLYPFWIDPRRSQFRMAKENT
jgi:hypothetical protein